LIEKKYFSTYVILLFIHPKHTRRRKEENVGRKIVYYSLNQ